MSTTLNETPKSDRLHIGFFGKRNSGKSSLVNFFTNQEVSIVSSIAGTTTDPVYKAMELNPIGAVVLIDTAGFDDEGELGKIRIKKTEEALLKTDIAVLVFHDENIQTELKWLKKIKDNNIPAVCVLNKIDLLKNTETLAAKIEKETQIKPILMSSVEKIGFFELKDEITRSVPATFGTESIVGSLAKSGDIVLLVMPQDIQAPKGRLILPQVQTIRNLLDKKCIVISTITDKLDETLNSLKNPPALIITDSQVFKYVYEKKPQESKLTSFSVLFAAYKGDIDYFTESTKQIDKLTENSKVLIAECCTHAPLSEDIGRVKIPKMLRNKYGNNMKIDIVSGVNFPENLDDYDLIIQCGGCMFNRKYIMARVEKAKNKKVPMTNYGVVIAYLTGILDKISKF